MQHNHLFVSSLKPGEAIYRKRLWLADFLDLLTGLAFGWAVVRFYDLGVRPGRAALVLLAGWAAYSTVCGLVGRSLWRWVVGVRLMAGDRPAGLGRSFIRAFTMIPDHVSLVLFHKRPFDGWLGVGPILEGVDARGKVKLFAWQLPWIACAVISIHFLIKPTRTEAIKYLTTLDGWRCCHGRLDEPERQCTHALQRLAEDARAADRAATNLYGDCPESSRMPLPQQP